jgi:hypothetical protein
VRKEEIKPFSPVQRARKFSAVLGTTIKNQIRIKSNIYDFQTSFAKESNRHTPSRLSANADIKENLLEITTGGMEAKPCWSLSLNQF